MKNAAVKTSVLVRLLILYLTGALDYPCSYRVNGELAVSLKRFRLLALLK